MKKYYCKICDKGISYESKLHGSGLCRSCSAIERYKIPQNNPNYKHGNNIINKKCIDCGKKIHPQADRCYKCEDKHHSILMTGRESKIKGIRYKIYYCINCKKEIMQETSKKSKMCVKCYQEYLRNHKKQHPRFGKILKPNWKKYNKIWFRSNWEVAYAKYLDEHNISWLYESKTFDLGNTTYTPDFYLPETNEYVEIKGYFSDIFKDKLKLFRYNYKDIKLSIIDKIKLLSLKRINKRGDII